MNSILATLDNRQKGKRKPTFTWSHVKRRRMDIVTEKERDSKEQANDAKMIPGVEGKLQWGFPNKIITNHRYVDYYILQSVNGSIATQIIRMNSIWDPDFSGVGHRPLYVDTYSDVYVSYRVLGSRLSARFHPVNAERNSTFGPYVVGINGSQSSSGLSTQAVNRIEQNDAVWDSMQPLESQPYTELEFAYSPLSKIGRSPGDDTAGALVNANPSQAYFAHIWMADTNAPAVSECLLTIQIEFTVEYFDLKQKSQA
jgi:hypothetical protein